MAEISQDITKARQLLDSGEVVGIPTETVYGLAGNALNEEALLKIFEIKNRPKMDPLILHFGSVDKIDAYVSAFPEASRALLTKLSPGPLTLLLERNERVPDLCCSGLPEIAVRIPRHPLTLSLLKSLSYPLAAPSANPFARVSPTSAAHVQDQLGDRVKFILDGGPCTVGLESTIIRERANEIEVLRLGGLSPEEIEAVAGKACRIISSEKHVPGSFKKHYATKTPLSIGIPDNPIDNSACLVWSKREDVDIKQFVLSKDGSSQDGARRLFALMREIDSMGFAHIYAEKMPEEGLGKAINDRLSRAAHP